MARARKIWITTRRHREWRLDNWDLLGLCELAIEKASMLTCIWNMDIVSSSIWTRMASILPPFLGVRGGVRAPPAPAPSTPAGVLAEWCIRPGHVEYIQFGRIPIKTSVSRYKLYDTLFNSTRLLFPWRSFTTSQVNVESVTLKRYYKQIICCTFSRIVKNY